MTHENKIRIALADDRPVVLRGLQGWIESHGRFTAASCVRRAEQWLTGRSAADFDLIVLGCHTQAARAFDFSLLRRLRRAFPAAPVIVLTDETSVDVLARIQSSGAAGLISSRDDANAFVRMHDRVLSGVRNVVSPCIADLLTASVTRDSDEEPARVSPEAPDYGGAGARITQFVARTRDRSN